MYVQFFVSFSVPVVFLDLIFGLANNIFDGLYEVIDSTGAAILRAAHGNLTLVLFTSENLTVAHIAGDTITVHTSGHHFGGLHKRGSFLEG